MKSYTLQEAMSQAKVNGRKFVDEFKNELWYDKDTKSIVLASSASTGYPITILYTKWYDWREFYEL